jgi:type I restriction enzyme S subunit
MRKVQSTQTIVEAADTHLPEGWESVQAAELCEINPPKPHADALRADELVTFVPMAAIDDDLGAITAFENRPFGQLRPKSYTPFAENDVLLAKITPCMENGKSALARGLTNKFGFGSTEFHVFRSMGAVLPEYLYYYIRQQSFRVDAQAHMTGTAGHLRVPVDYIRGFKLPLAPLAEQKRIAATVHELLETTGAVRARLAKLPALLKRFRQSVLAAVCSGQITADWRASHLQATVSDDRLCNSENDIAEQDQVEVPEPWELIPAADLFDWSSGKNLPEKTMRPGPHPVYGGNGISGRHDKFLVANPTIIVGRVGALCGNVYLSEPEAWVTDNAIYAKNASPSVDIVFARLVFDNAKLNTRSGGTGQPFVNQQILDAVGFPLPPIGEQREIVRRVEVLFGLAEGIKDRIRAATVLADRLPPAILARAFRGELVPTEAELAAEEGRDYEPASVLLERIQESRKQTKPAKRGRGGNARVYCECPGGM